MKARVELEGPVWRSRQGLSRRLSRGAVIAGAGPVALTLLLTLVGEIIHLSTDALFALGALVWMAGWVSLPLIWVASEAAARRWRLGLCAIALDAGGVTLVREKGTLVIPAHELAGALVVAARPVDEIELTTRSGVVYAISVASAAEAHDAVDALGMGSAGRRVAVSVQDAASGGAGCGALVLGLVAGAVLLFLAALANRLHTWLLYPAGVVFVVTAALVHKAMEGKRIVVGTDGVSVEGPFRTRFVPRASIEGVAFDRSGTHLALKNGKKVTIGGTGPREQGLADRIEAALHRVSEHAEPAALSLLERGGRTFAEWSTALRPLASADAGYRQASYDVGTLTEIACDADAPADRRLGAAVALAASGDGDARQRVRVAAAGLASEPFRIALAKAADDELDEAAFEEALEASRRAVGARS